MSRTRDEYDRFWRDYVSDGPVDWRGSHHAEPDPEFATLCDDAERLGYVVRLVVGSGTVGLKARPHRLLTSIEVGPLKGTPVVTSPLAGGRSIRDAAASARERLEALS